MSRGGFIDCVPPSVSNLSLCGKSPLSRTLTQIAKPISNKTVYVDNRLGRDSNVGSETHPVRTIQGAMNRLEQFSADQGIISLVGGQTHDLGVNTTLDFFPLSGRYRDIIFEGPKTVLLEDRIATNSTFHGPGDNWIILTGLQSGSYTPGAFDNTFIYNSTIDSYATIQSNTTTDIETVLQFIGPLTLPYWEPGQSITVYDLSAESSATIQFTGILTVLSAPQNCVTFRCIRMDPLPTVDPPFSINDFPLFICPRTFDPLIKFTGSHMITRGNLGVYTESMIVEGCRAQGFRFDPMSPTEVVIFNFAFGDINIQCQTLINSIFLNTCLTAGGDCRYSALLINDPICPSFWAIDIRDAVIHFTGIEINRSPGGGVYFLRGNRGTLGPIDIFDNFGTAITFDAGNSVDLDTVEITFDGSAPASSAGIFAEDANTLRIIRYNCASAPSHGIHCIKGNFVAIEDSDSPGIIGSGGDGIRMETGGVLSLTSVVISSSAGDGILARYGCRLSGTSVSGTGNGGLGCKVELGADASFSNTPTITGTGGDAQAGIAPVSTWTAIATRTPGVSNDFALASTQNCFILV